MKGIQGVKQLKFLLVILVVGILAGGLAGGAVAAPSEVRQEDVTAPTLLNISSSPATVGVVAGPAPITVTVQLTDDLAGVQQWLVSFSSPSGDQSLQVFGTPGLITGTNLNGTFQGTSVLPQFSESGDWQATFLSMTDNAGNNISVNLVSAGFPLSFTVTSQDDVTAPKLLNISSSPATVDVVAGPAPITVTVQLTDDLAGVQQWLVSFSSPSGDQSLQVFGTPGLITGTNLNGTFQGTSMLPQFSESGDWQATFLSMTDNAGNNISVNLVSAGFPLSFTVLPIAIQVSIDIKPGSDPNSINCNNEKGVIAAAILTTEDFDATTVDHTTVFFEGVSETHVHKKSRKPRRHEEDADGDGDTDLIFHFRVGDTGLACSSTEGTLIGETFDGQSIEGTDAVRMVG